MNRRSHSSFQKEGKRISNFYTLETHHRPLKPEHSVELSDLKMKTQNQSSRSRNSRCWLKLHLLHQNKQKAQVFSVTDRHVTARSSSIKAPEEEEEVPRSDRTTAELNRANSQQWNRKCLPASKAPGWKPFVSAPRGAGSSNSSRRGRELRWSNSGREREREMVTVRVTVE